MDYFEALELTCKIYENKLHEFMTIEEMEGFNREIFRKLIREDLNTRPDDDFKQYLKEIYEKGETDD